jgi:hypothetical protein
MHAAHEAWVARTGDLGAIPEAELAPLRVRRHPKRAI